MKTDTEVRDELNRLEALSGRWSELGLVLWFVAWLLDRGPAVSNVIEELEAKAHDMLGEKVNRDV